MTTKLVIRINPAQPDMERQLTEAGYDVKGDRAIPLGQWDVPHDLPEAELQKIRVFMATKAGGGAQYRGHSSPWRWENGLLKDANGNTLIAGTPGVDPAVEWLTERAPDFAHVLVRLEWVRDAANQSWCPMCRGLEPDHGRGCELAAVLDGARV